jgi:beta-lactamase superfamily II metal-dependent hydrolase
MAYLETLYSNTNEASIYAKIHNNKSSGKPINKILMGTWVGVTEIDGDWRKVVTAGPNGWIHKDSLREKMGLKVFYVDVGQGDGAFMEMGNTRIIIDGGPNNNFYKYLKYHFNYLLKENKKVHFEHVIVSHYDDDHFRGLISLIKDDRFTFGTIFHNGIARFYTSDDISNGKIRPDIYNEDLGTVIQSGSDRYLTTKFSTLNQLKELQNLGGLKYRFNEFTNAVKTAEQEGRLDALKMLDNGDVIDLGSNHGANAKIDILGPILTKVNDNNSFEWFDDSSHTRNGHSVVAKLTYGTRTMLFGGDLNSASETHLLKNHPEHDVFKVDISKQCHHGSSDFTVDFIKKMKPFATVISSGDNESHAHPRAEAIGCAGKYSRGVRPKVFSTELARSVNSKNEVLYGMINLRCDGDRLYMSQMKEAKKGSDVWDSYVIFD